MNVGNDGWNPPPAALARGFGERLHRWSLAGGAGPAAAQAAREAGEAVCRALEQGQVCLRVESARAALLLASGVVSRPGSTAAPLVLDAENRLYLARYHDYEERLARALAARLAVAPTLPPGTARKAHELLAAMFPADDTAPDWQKLAVAMSLLGRLTIVSGGPGTGKTSTVVRMLACLLAVEPRARIALAAPTGKAAARMHEAVLAAAAGLERVAPDLRAGLPVRALTLHRLLGYSPGGGFVHSARRPLPLEVLVVDEASMLDLALATRLCEALPAQARLILLGDKDQLAAVEAGAIFAGLAADPTLSSARRASLSALTGLPAAQMATAPSPAATPLVDHVIWLQRNYRFAAQSGIHGLASRVREGAADAALDLLARAPQVGSDGDLEWLRDATPGGGLLLERLLAGYAEYLSLLEQPESGAQDPATLFAVFNRFRVLCATRGGAVGVAAINARLTAAVQARLGGAAAAEEWFVGRPVMVLHNDHAQQLFNGDVGIALPSGEDRQLCVHFPAAEGGSRAVPPARLPLHETAFAMTVHKAQGSEFDAVALVLPPVADSPGVTRELVYTGITRARAKVILCAEEATLRAGIARTLERGSGLVTRLREICRPAI